MTNSPDRAPRSFWDKQWTNERVPRPVDPRDNSARNSLRLAFHAYFSRHFDRFRGRADVELLEAGCARSIWLPYFSREFGFEVSGIDYSETGCQKSREILAAQNVAGRVLEENIFAPSPDLVGRFDVVVSFGLIEHFEDSAGAVRALAAYLKPGGTMITNIPNMRGTVGLVQRLFNRAVYDQHIPHTTATLAAAHEAAGLRIQDCSYFLSTGYNVVNFQRPDRGGSVSPLGALAKALLTSLSVAIWVLEKPFGGLPVSRAFSPYVHCAAVKPEQP